jgi:hypothetical protein
LSEGTWSKRFRRLHMKIWDWTCSDPIPAKDNEIIERQALSSCFNEPLEVGRVSLFQTFPRLPRAKQCQACSELWTGKPRGIGGYWGKSPRPDHQCRCGLLVPTKSGPPHRVSGRTALAAHEERFCGGGCLTIAGLMWREAGRPSTVREGGTEAAGPSAQDRVPRAAEASIAGF